MAPEVFKGSETYDKSVDIFSFSMIIYTLFVEKQPADSDFFAKEDDLEALLISGKRPIIPDSCSKDVGYLMKQCWNENTTKRPSFDMIYLILKYGREGVKARQKSTAFLDKYPELDEDEIVWTFGSGTVFTQLCAAR